MKFSIVSPISINETVCDGSDHFSLHEITKILLSIRRKAEKANPFLLHSESTPIELGSLENLTRRQLLELLSISGSLLQFGEVWVAKFTAITGAQGNAVVQPVVVAAPDVTPERGSLITRHQERM